MVIDFHVHIGLKEHWHAWVQDYQKATGSEYYKRYEELTDPDRFALYLQSGNVAKAVILPQISPVTTGIIPNEYVFDFCRGRDIFIPFCTVNPSLTVRPAEEILKFIRLGARGIKLYPSYDHFYPNDPALYPVYTLAQEHRLPVMFHTGSSVFRGAKMKYADPIHLDDVAADFPELVLVMAHGGRGFWYDKAFFLSRIHPYLFVEISGLPPPQAIELLSRHGKKHRQVHLWLGLAGPCDDLQQRRGDQTTSSGRGLEKEDPLRECGPDSRFGIGKLRDFWLSEGLSGSSPG